MKPSTPTPPAKLVIGLSSSSLFDTSESNGIYQDRPLADYVEHQVARENVPFPKGTAFPLLEVMMRLNGEKKPFELVVLSKNEPAAGSRVTNSLAHYGFENVRSVFTGGEPVAQHCEGMKVDLFLSREPGEVKRAMACGIAAGLLYAPPNEFNVELDQLRVAFDFDGVLANLEAELVYQKTKPDLQPYRAHEVEKADIPLPPGPLFPVLQKLSAIKADMESARHAMFPENEAPDVRSLALALKVDESLIERAVKAGPANRTLFRAADEGRLEAAGFTMEEANLVAHRVRVLFSPIEIALVTARNPPVEKRLMNTLKSWGIRVDQMFLMGGLPKTPVLKKFKAHIFFDDQKAHTEKACNDVPTSLVLWPEADIAKLAAPNPTADPLVPMTAPATKKIRVEVLAAADFEAQCRAIFKSYALAGGEKSRQLDPRFRTFIQKNRGRSGAERAQVLERLRQFDLTPLAGSHNIQLGRDRLDVLVQKLDWIAGKAPQSEMEFGGQKKAD